MFKRTLSIRVLRSVCLRFAALCRDLRCTQEDLVSAMVQAMDCDAPQTVPVQVASSSLLQGVSECRPGQRHWWLRGPGGFIAIPANAVGTWDKHRQGWLATQPIAFEVRLPPGIYTLGAGTREQGVRQVVVVTPPHL